MPTKTKKVKAVKELSGEDLKKLQKKYSDTKRGSKQVIASNLWKYSKHVMGVRDLKKIEDFLKLTESKRYKGPRYGTRKNGNLYCISGACDLS